MNLTVLQIYVHSIHDIKRKLSTHQYTNIDYYLMINFG